MVVGDVGTYEDVNHSKSNPIYEESSNIPNPIYSTTNIEAYDELFKQKQLSNIEAYDELFKQKQLSSNTASDYSKLGPVSSTENVGCHGYDHLSSLDSKTCAEFSGNIQTNMLYDALELDNTHSEAIQTGQMYASLNRGGDQAYDKLNQLAEFQGDGQYDHINKQSAGSSKVTVHDNIQTNMLYDALELDNSHSEAIQTGQMYASLNRGGDQAYDKLNQLAELQADGQYDHINKQSAGSSKVTVHDNIQTNLIYDALELDKCPKKYTESNEQAYDSLTYEADQSYDKLGHSAKNSPKEVRYDHINKDSEKTKSKFNSSADMSSEYADLSPVNTQQSQNVTYEQFNQTNPSKSTPQTVSEYAVPLAYDQQAQIKTCSPSDLYSGDSYYKLNFSSEPSGRSQKDRESSG